MVDVCSLCISPDTLLDLAAYAGRNITSILCNRQYVYRYQGIK